MRGPERGFLLLTGTFGDPERKPLTVAQLRTLAARVKTMQIDQTDRQLQPEDLVRLGYGRDMAERIVKLLSDEAILDRYMQRANRVACYPISRVSEGYPDVLRQKLGVDSPGCLWAKGNGEILMMPRISLVGSRDIQPANRAFAWEVGVQAAKQGFALVSGNARGADKIAQTACLQHGGRVIWVVADGLADKTLDERILYLSENDFDQPFSAQRAISRNRVIHALGEKTFVAQCHFGTGGTWDGAVKNLRNGWSPVYCMDDGSRGCLELKQLGANLVNQKDLTDIRRIQSDTFTFFDQ